MLRALAEIWAYPAVRYASLGAGFNAFVGYGVLNFMPSFLSRVHGLESGTIGTFLSLAVGKGGQGGAIDMDILQCEGGSILFRATFFGNGNGNDDCDNLVCPLATREITKTCK